MHLRLGLDIEGGSKAKSKLLWNRCRNSELHEKQPHVARLAVGRSFGAGTPYLERTLVFNVKTMKGTDKYVVPGRIDTSCSNHRSTSHANVAPA
jgi:hypothetical protein